MYFADLQLCFYDSGPLDAYEWQVPLRAVGWLEHPHEFTKGTTPEGLVAKINEIVEQAHSIYYRWSFCGYHQCSHCMAAGTQAPLLVRSDRNIFVPGIDVVYAAPAGIVHYIEEHSYLPPAEFIQAVMSCPDCRSDEYRAALRAANGGVAPPLKIDKPFKKVRRQSGTLLDITSERRERILEGESIRDDATYYTIDDGQLYIYVLKHTLRRDEKELTATVNAPIIFGVIYEEIGDDIWMVDARGEAHQLSLHNRYPRAKRDHND